MVRAIATALATLALSAATASAHTVLVDTNGNALGGQLQAWVDGSLLPTPDTQLTVSFSNPEDLVNAAYFLPTVSTSVVYIAHPDEFGRKDMLHEIGHLYDYTYLTDSDRAAFTSLLGDAPGRDWRSTGDSPHEQFAEAYAFGAMMTTYKPGHIQVNYGLRFARSRFDLLRAWLINIPRLAALG